MRSIAFANCLCVCVHVCVRVRVCVCAVCVCVCVYTDGLDLYPINPLNPPMYPEPRNYMCGHWLVEYQKVHNGEQNTTFS